jgi:hypothetical protein
MRCAVIAFLALCWPQDTNEARRALAEIKKVEGKVAFDDKAPGRPVIGLNL